MRINMYVLRRWKSYGIVCSLLFMVFVNAFSEETILYSLEEKKTSSIPKNIPLAQEQRIWKMNDYALPWLIVRNKDNKITSATRIHSEDFTKLVEVLDTNVDGLADDFVFFNDKGEVLYHEIDSNFDNKIDLWVFVAAGKYITRFQRDKDYDGYIDLERIF